MMARVRPYVEDAVLALSFAVVAVALRGPFAAALLVAIPAVFAWGAVTLHFPTRVAWDDERVSFSAYGRTHTFLWKNVTRVAVRRFVVKDRVLVRLRPASAWRGRYWIRDFVDGSETLITELERRAIETHA